MRNIFKAVPHYHFFKYLPIVFIALICCNGKEGEKETLAQKEVLAPTTKKRPYKLELHGISLYDEYDWLKNLENSEVREHLREENAYSEKALERTKDLQETLIREDSGNKAPLPTNHIAIGNYEYYSKEENNKRFPVFYRKLATSSKEEVVLDLNIHRKSDGYLRLDIFEPSPDHQLIAYSIDTTGNGNYNLYIRNVQAKQASEVIPEVGNTAAWGNDSQTLLYTTKDDGGRCDKLFLHKLLIPYEEDKLLFLEEDPDFSIKINKSKNNQFLVLESESDLSAEVHYLPAHEPNARLQLFSERVPNVKYKIYPHGEKFFVLTNFNKKESQIMVAVSGATNIKNWQPYFLNPNDYFIDEVEIFANYLVLYSRKNGLPNLQFKNLATHDEDSLQFDEPFFNIVPYKHSDFNNNTLIFSYESILTPPSLVTYRLDSREKFSLDDQIIKDYNQDDLLFERIYATSSDGTPIPLSLVYKKEFKGEHPKPLCLYVHGAYGINSISNLNASTSLHSRHDLLNKGFVIAIAHVRGSGDMEHSWHEAGTYPHKNKSIHDFLACSKLLLQKKYTSSEKLIAMGEGAGGITVGAAALINPDIYRAIVLDEPYLDMVNLLLSSDFKNTKAYKEWGNPGDEEAFNNILTYSPYDNIEAKKYPNMFIMAGFRKDSPPTLVWQAAKWTSRIREYNSGNSLILFRNYLKESENNSERIREEQKVLAMRHAFILDMVKNHVEKQ